MEHYSIYDRFPAHRKDCRVAARPCPWVRCKWHLYLTTQGEDRAKRQGCRRNRLHGKELWEIPRTCVLDIADQGGATLEEVGRIIGVSRERIRQIEEHALRQLRPYLEDIAGALEGDPDVPLPACLRPFALY